MLNKLKEFRALNAFAKRQSVGMQRKLMLYWVSMILVVFAAVILLLSIAGAFSQNDVQLHEVMELHMNNTRDSLTNHLDRLTAQSLKLSRELSRELEAALAQEGVTLGEANDDPERLLRAAAGHVPAGQHDPADSRLQRRICDTGRDGQHLFGGGGALQKRHPPALLQPQRQQPGHAYGGLLPRYPRHRPAKGP